MPARIAGSTASMRMWVYIVRRAVLVFPVFVGVLTVLFVLVSTLPEVDRTCAFYPSTAPNPSPLPVSSSAGGTTPCSATIPCPSNPAQICPNPTYQSAVNALGLDQPTFVQWAIFVGNGLTFQWGVRQSV